MQFMYPVFTCFQGKELVAAECGRAQSTRRRLADGKAGRWMFSNHRIQTVLEEMREIAKLEMALYTAEGKLAGATFEVEEELAEQVIAFVHSRAESQTLAGSHFFRVLVEGETEYVLLAKSVTEDTYMVGRLIACQIRNLAAAYMEQSDRNHFMHHILLGNMLPTDMYSRAKKLHIGQAERVVFVIDMQGKKDSTVMAVIKNLFVTKAKDFIIEADTQSIILIKDTEKQKTEEQLDALARMMLDGIHGEAMVRVRIGYGNRTKELSELSKSYQEAILALKVGRTFYAERETLSYRRLGIGRLIYQLPMSLCDIFLQEVFGEKIPELIWEEETMTTLQKFFENNLNVSETARQLYVHRNTLVYRLERMEKELGLDIRKFEDAMTFKLAMMVLAHKNDQKQEHTN